MNTSTTLTLVVRQDYTTGEYGFMIKGVPQLDHMPMVAVEGALIAHDILEHVNGFESIGTIKDELEAMGALWFIRGQFGEIQRKRPSVYSADENIASDVSRMAVDSILGNTNEPILKVKHNDISETFTGIVDIAKRDTIKELSYHDEDYNKTKFKHYFKFAASYMQIGYDKAQEKYKNATLVNSLFWTIAESFDRFVKHSEMIEGMEVNLVYGYEHDNVFCRVEEIYEEEESYEEEEIYEEEESYAA